MNVVRITMVLATICLTCSSFAAEKSKAEEEKQMARDNCIAAVQERYGSGTTSSKPKKKKLSRKRGYAFRMKVGEQNKSVNCFSDLNGKTKFYKGSL